MMPSEGQPPESAGLTARPPLTLAEVSRLFAGAMITVDAALEPAS